MHPSDRGQPLGYGHPRRNGVSSISETGGGEGRALPTTYTPLRYPGGKSRLSHYLSHLLRQNRMTGCLYVEPFAGGAGAAINLLRKGYVQSALLNDIDPGIVAFWNAVLRQTEDLCGLIHDTPVTMDEWRRQREVLASAASTALQRGFATLYLNRTNRSGVIGGGVIGGQRQRGTWKLDARFNRATLAAKVREIACYRDRIKLYGMDGSRFLTDVVVPLKDSIFLYLDPPYYGRGKDLYHNHYGHEDHVELAKVLGNRLADRPWVISYDDTPETRAIYEGFRSLSYAIRYSAAARYQGAEIMFFGPAIKEPLLEDPLSVVSYARASLAKKTG